MNQVSGTNPVRDKSPVSTTEVTILRTSNGTNRTILFHSSNREDPKFEQKIIDNVVKLSGGLPIISVTQKPMNLGKNICVGDVGLSYLNLFRQMYLGALEITTPFFINIDSDSLYPPEYFSFIPDKKGVTYRYNNNYIVFNTPKHNMFYKKREFEGAEIVDRELFLKKCEEEFFVGMPPWFAEGKDGKMPIKRREPLHNTRKIFFGGKNPCISFKTDRGISWKAHLMHGSETIKLPYWGTINQVKRKYLKT